MSAERGTLCVVVICEDVAVLAGHNLELELRPSFGDKRDACLNEGR